MTDLDLKAGRALVIMAHPDDETIWMGGAMLFFNQTKWTIFSLCRSDDLDRAPKFRRVCRFYQAQGIITDLEDEGIMNVKETLPEIEKRIIKKINKKYNYIFTHWSNGEYGHPRHKGVYKTVNNLILNKRLKCDKLFYTAYELDAKQRIINHKKASHKLKLPSQIFKTKRDIVKQLYGFSQKSFENISCLPMETFKIAKKYEDFNVI